METHRIAAEARQRVAVIGAGASGLVALRYLTKNGGDKTFEVVGFEQTATIGGVWQYTEKTGRDEEGYLIHSSAYDALISNIPKQLIEYSEMPHSDVTSTFPTRHDVIGYMKRYAEEFDLVKYLKFNTRVVDVLPDKGQGDTLKWKLEIRQKDPKSRRVTRESLTFDTALICVGNASVPSWPDIPGLTEFKGQLMHSHDFRTAKEFTDKVVVVIGAMFSGLDLSLQIATTAKQVYLSSKDGGRAMEEPLNLKQVEQVSYIKGKIVTVTNGDEVEADAVVVCTGYVYSFPFLDKAGLIEIRNGTRVDPLYQHMIHVEYPSLMFIGLPSRVPTFMLAEYQMKYVVAILSKKVFLPSKEKMLEETKKTYKKLDSLGTEQSKCHLLYNMEHDVFRMYLEKLATLGGFDPPAPVYFEFFRHSITRLFENFSRFRDIEYRLVGSNEIDFEEY